jgi:predicted MPP superfamily phosphohydrolase
VNSFLLEPNLPVVFHHEIKLRRWPSRLDGFTIALLSDFHYDPFFSVHPIRRSIDLVNNLRPDLVVLTGDFVTVPVSGNAAKAAAAAEPCAELLGQLRAPFGLWAVLGNHDIFSDPRRIVKVLSAKGIQVLMNRAVPIEKDNARFWLCGVDDVMGGLPNLDATLKHVPADEASVLLAHEPDYADYVVRYPIDLQLSGHSHGGQVRLPLVPPLFLPPLAKKYVWGLFKVGALTLYTSAGIGTVRVPMRFNCPAEITFIRITKAS